MSLSGSRSYPEMHMALFSCLFSLLQSGAVPSSFMFSTLCEQCTCRPYRVGLSGDFSWPGSGHAFLAGMLRKCCAFLSESRGRGLGEPWWQPILWLMTFVFFLFLSLLTTFIHLVMLILITSHVGVCQVSPNVKSFPPFILIGILRGNILALYQTSIQQCWPLPTSPAGLSHCSNSCQMIVFYLHYSFSFY